MRDTTSGNHAPFRKDGGKKNYSDGWQHLKYYVHVSMIESRTTVPARVVGTSIVPTSVDVDAILPNELTTGMLSPCKGSVLCARSLSLKKIETSVLEQKKRRKCSTNSVHL